MRRLLTGGLAIGLFSAGVLAAVPAAQAVIPAGSRAEVFTATDTGDGTGGYSGDPSKSIALGSWGHEGPLGTGATVFSADFRDEGAFFSAMGISDYSELGIAFVAKSADGSAERPFVDDGDLAGDAFTWFSLTPALGSIQGNSTAEDFVDTVSTQAEWDAWIGDGAPSVDYNSQLQQRKPLVTGQPVTAHPSGKSILNRWAAGQDISLVYFVITGTTTYGEPIVKKGADGRAIAAWTSFRTIASSTSAIRTSAGYQILGGKVTPTVTLSHTISDGTGSLKATVSPAAAGTVAFTSSSCAGSSFTPVGNPVQVVNGVATFPLSGFTSSPICVKFHGTFTPADTSAYDSASDEGTGHSVFGVDVVVLPPPPPPASPVLDEPHPIDSAVSNQKPGTKDTVTGGELEELTNLVTSDIPGVTAISSGAGADGATADAGSVGSADGAATGEGPAGSSGTDAAAESRGSTRSGAAGGGGESWLSTSSAKAVGGVVMILLVVVAGVALLAPRRPDPEKPAD